MLVSSRVKDGQLWFEVHKEGLSFLRSFKNKRLRIIFNISQSTKSLQPFNRHFLSQPVPQQNPPCSPAPYHSIIQISPIFKELQDNRVIIFLNVYHNNNDVLEEMKDNAKSPHVQILVIGYLIASVFMYHHEGKFGDPADPFCTILGKLGIMLKDTDVNQLQQEIKYTTGFAKKPYFMCLCKEKQADTDANYHQLFRQTYKYQEGQDKLNEAVDTLIDYFPQRTAIYIGDYEDSIEQQQRIQKLGTGYEKQILGRHIFNFQLTAGTVESLCFQLCEQFNKKKNENRNINLLKIYNKIIINQKSQILSIMTQNYKNIMDELYKKLPMENVELNQCYYNIEKYILQEAIDYGCNCMSFYEFVHTYSSIRPLFSKGFQSLLASNKEVKRNLALEAFQNVEDHLPVKPESPTLLHCLQSIKGYSQCLDIFIQSTIQDFTMRDLLCRLLQKNTEEVYQQLQQVQSEYRKQMKHYEQRISSLELQNKAYQYKFKQFQSEFIYLHAINQEFKQKLLSGSGSGSGSGISNGFDKGAQLKQSEVVLELKKRILDLQFQMCDKNSVINSLSQILDRLEVEMSRKYHKQKFSKQTQSFLSQLTQKCHSLYSLFAQLQKTHSFYTTIQSQYELKKQQIYNQQQKQKQKIEQQKQKINQFIKQRKFMQQIINEEKRSIDVLEKVQLEYKDALEEMENIGSRGKCQLAELEGMFEKWKKALELVVGFVVTGKNQRLRDFYKVCMEVDLKEVLKPIFKK